MQAKTHLLVEEKRSEKFDAKPDKGYNGMTGKVEWKNSTNDKTEWRDQVPVKVKMTYAFTVS